jgi:hypothetical protein
MKRGDLCPRKQCRSVLVIGTNGHGVTVASCPKCERNKAGFCRDCPARIVQTGRSLKMLCAACRKRRDNDRHKRAYRADPDHFRRLKRESEQRKNPDQLAARREYNRRYNQAHFVSDEFYRRYKREYMRVYLSDPKKRAAMNARRRELAALRRSA